MISFEVVERASPTLPEPQVGWGIRCRVVRGHFPVTDDSPPCLNLRQQAGASDISVAAGIFRTDVGGY